MGAPAPAGGRTGGRESSIVEKGVVVEDAGYGIVRHVRADYEEAVRLTRDALKEHGFGVLTEIDVKKTLKEKLDQEFRPYIILGACNPPLAYKALTAETDIGLLLPCNVVVYEEAPGRSVVEAVSPMAALGIVENEALMEVAEQATASLEAAMEAVAQRAGA
jgi:uncharacterized protein (DUF302 family)